MNYSEYKYALSNFERPSSRQTHNFINYVSNDHSWYKHLNEQRNHSFIFYLDPYVGEPVIVSENDLNNRYIRKRNILNKHQSSFSCWNYYTDQYTFNYIINCDGIVSDPRAVIGLNIMNEEGIIFKIPDEVVRIGEFKMSRYLHKRAFENANNYLSHDGITYSEKHRIIIDELEIHLNHILDRIYN
jgi:hypothetical protein